jgi:16S rRNA (adenine1518-N6/adenine1519-N6)-dimethyltransferase
MSGSLRQQVLADLASAGCRPLHRFGQNFMVDPRVVDDLLAALPPLAGARVVEVGPGTGVLTTRLIDAGAQVLAVEIDRGLAAHLQTTLVPRGLHLEVGDALAGKSRLHPAIEAWAAAGPWLLAANLPYDAAIPILLEAAALPQQPVAMAATVQFECAQRLCSAPGDDAWGASAAVLQASGSPRLVRRIGRDAFHPRPNVDSAIVAWTPGGPLPRGFAAWVRTVFSYRRKLVPRALMDAGLDRAAAEAACAAAGIAADRRLEGLSAGELTALHRHLPENPCAA